MSTKALMQPRSISRKSLLSIAVFIATMDLASAAVIEEVIVTAQKREQSVNDVPITISAFTGEQLKDLGVVDARDLGKIVPSFKYSATGLNKPVFTLRGIGYNDFSQTASGTVGIYIGEFNLPYPIMAKGPSLDIQRIEVLKGPQGTLYGRNTTGGVVNFIPNAPGEEFEAGVTATYSRFETFDTEAYVSGYLTDSLGMRLAARKIKSNEGWQYSLTRPDEELGKQDKWSARYTLDWSPAETFRVSLGLDRWEDTGEPQAAQPIAIEAVNPIVGDAVLAPSVANHPLVPRDTGDNRVAEWPAASEGYDWQLNDKFSMARLRLDLDVGEFSTLSYLGSYAKFEADKETLPTSGLSVLNAEALMDVDTEAQTHELRLSGALGEHFDYIVGGFVSEDDVYQYWTGLVRTLSVLFPDPVTGQSQVADKLDSFIDQHAETKAVFFDITWLMTQNFSLSVGARYTDEQRDMKGCTADNADAAGFGFNNVMNLISLTRGGAGGAGRGDCVTLDHNTGNPGLVVKDLEENNTSGRIVLDWTPADGMLFYVSRSRGFKSGGFPIGQASDSEQYRPSIQEQLDSWELGGKLSLLDSSVQLNFAGFDYDYRNKQLLSYTYDDIFGAIQQLDNAPQSKVQGAEVDVRARPTEAFDMFLAASYIDTEIEEFVGINQSGQTEDFSGQKFNNAPDLTGTIGLRYQLSLPQVDAFDLAFGVDYSYAGETSSALNDDPRYKVEDYDNINAQISVIAAQRNWKITLWGHNLADEYQTVSVGATASDAIQRYVQMPRTYGVTAQYSFGGEL